MSGLWVGLGTAALGAYSSNRQASAANKPKTAWTDQTTTQNPYFAGQMNPDIEEVLNYQRGLIQQGAPTLNSKGQLVYNPIPQGTRPGGLDSYSDPNDPRFKNLNPNGPGGPGGNVGGGHRDEGGVPDQFKPIASPSSTYNSSGSKKSGGKSTTWTNAKGELMMLGPNGQAIKAPPGTQPQGPKSITGSPVAAGPNLSTPQGIFSEVARRGLDAGNTETQTGARNLMANIWGAAGTPGGSTQAGAGAERTGFEGYNPILDRQAQRLEAGADNRIGRDLILGFLGENKRAGGVAPTDSRSVLNFGGQGGQGAQSGQGTTSPNLGAKTPVADPTRVSPARAARGMVNQEWLARNNPTPPPEPDPAAQTQAQMQPQSQPQMAASMSIPDVTPVYGRPANANDVPDTMAVQSFFGDETRKMMDEEANEAELQAVIDSMNADVERGMFRDMAQLDAAAAGSGRFGGSTWSAMSRDAREEALQEMLKTGAQVRVGDRESRRNARLNALAGVNQRDQSQLGANVNREGLAVQREGIAAGERASANAAGAASAAQEAQMQLAMRGQDLGAISDLLGYEQFEMGQLGNIGGQLSGDRLGSLGMVPGLEGISASGLNSALGAGGGMVDMRGQDTQRQIAGQQANIARQGLNQQLGMFNAGQQQNAVNNYLGTLMNIGQMGGTSHTQGQNVQPGLGVSPGAATAQGALGGFLAGYGAYNQYR